METESEQEHADHQKTKLPCNSMVDSGQPVQKDGHNAVDILFDKKIGINYPLASTIEKEQIFEALEGAIQSEEIQFNVLNTLDKIFSNLDNHQSERLRAFELITLSKDPYRLPIIKNYALINCSDKESKIYTELILPAREALVGLLDGDLAAETITSIYCNSIEPGESSDWGRDTLTQNFGRLTDTLKSTIEGNEAGMISKCVAALLCNEGDLKKEEFSQFIASYGLDPDTLTKAWTESYSEGWNDLKKNDHDGGKRNFFTILFKNIENMAYLEGKKPGSTKILYEQFGITDFGRYNAGDLLSQTEQANNNESEYTVVVLARSDYNGAFYETSHLLHAFTKEMNQHGYLVRVVEVADKLSLYKKLAQMDKHYNQDGQNKIIGAVIGGHGSPNSINFGAGNDYKNRLMTDDFLIAEYQDKYGLRKTNPINRVSGFFQDNPQIILWSCSTGKDDESIGAAISRDTKSQVTAPSVPTAPNSLEVEFDENNRPKMTTSYSSIDHLRTFMKGHSTEKD